ncbi:peroxisomal biogenesis factor 19-like isoform X1 [Dinothrombium tinctorium]|uniref:Peroxin-19 n=1 Tax=Dinothrombium tinctorium TaxID=1965070 RepID=A0A443QM82_9ACAR|nr:peroxisomal biogenesis factor 19-like isoform X1 [Dinothrombium tinctorium]
MASCEQQQPSNDDLSANEAKKKNSESQRKEAKGAENEDEELNALLDSALSDFKKCDRSSPSFSSCLSASTNTEATAAKPKSTETTAKKTAKAKTKKSEPRKEEMPPEMEQFLKGFVDSDPLLKEQWNKLTESCQKAGSLSFYFTLYLNLTTVSRFSANASNDEEFEESLSETLKNLTENAKSLAENTDISDEELQKIWMNLKESGATEGSAFPDMLPLVTNMMQSLLSKDILHPALKDLTVKYPEWLDQNKDNVSAEDLKRYTKQLELMKQICAEFDAEREDDSGEVKNTRFQKVLALMQEMQTCGVPPKELVADGSDFGMDGEFDFSKMPGFPNSAPGSEKCNIM